MRFFEIPQQSNFLLLLYAHRYLNIAPFIIPQLTTPSNNNSLELEVTSNEKKERRRKKIVE